MADSLLGTINILRDNNSHDAGDIITVFYDPDTRAFTVYRDPVGGGANAIITSFDGLISNRDRINPYWARQDTGFEYLSSTNTISYFVGYTSFPYYLERSRPLIDTGVQDLNLGIDSITQASAAGVADASVVLVATGTNTPFAYSIDGITYQSSATFTGLYSALYTFYCRDSKANVDTVEINIPVDSTPVEAVSHGVKYRLDFYNIVNNRPNRLEIFQRGYSSSVTNMTGGSDPVLITARAEGGNLITDTTVISHELRMSLLSNTFKQYSEFATADEYEFLVLFYVDDSVAKDKSDFNVRFRGYITPETYTEEYGSPPYNISVTAHDRLADLNRITFYESSVLDDNFNRRYQPIKGILSQAVLIDKALKNIKLNQGYRIAIDMWETSMTPSTTNTPLHNAYENTETYYDDKGKAVTCMSVIEKILKPYGAILFSYMDYFYIVKEEQLRTTNVEYVQYATITGSGTAGSWNPRITYKAAGSTSYWRFAGNHTLEYTRPVKNVNIIAQGVKREDSAITPLWNVNNIDYIDGNFNGFKRFELVTNSDVFSALYSDGNEYGWILNPRTPFISANSYIRNSQEITFTSLDKIKIKFDFRTDVFTQIRTGLLVPPFPYLPMKWSLMIGTDYLKSDGTWTSTSTTNQFFVESSSVNTGSFNNFSIEAIMPEGYPTPTTSTYDLKIYPVSIWEYDILATDANDAKDEMENILTVGLRNGTRRIIRFEGDNEYVYFYYEFRRVVDPDVSKSNLTEIKPVDYGATKRGRWFSLGSWGESTTASTSSMKTYNIFKNLYVKTLPNGQEPADEFGDVAVVSSENNIDIDVTLGHFDLTDEVVNDENIFINYTRRSDGTPTTIWSRGDFVEVKSRQAHLKDRLYELFKLPRYKLNPKIYSDLELSIIKHLYVQDDDGRIFILNGIEINPKTGLHSGEILEIYQDNTPIASAFDSGFDTGFS